MNHEPNTSPHTTPEAPERLLCAALQLFTSRGFAATSVREIVEAAGVTKPVLYYYFRNKEGIYLAIMEQAWGIFEQQLATVADRSGTARERLIRFCLALFDTVRANLPIVRLIYAIYFGPPQGAPQYNLDQFYERMLKEIEGIVRDGIATGELRPADPTEMCWAVTSGLNTIMEEQLCREEPRIGRDGLERVLNLIIDGLAGGTNR